MLLRADRVVAVDKPAGVTSEDVARDRGLRLCHRIDKATSGLLLLAEDARTVQRWQRQVQAGQVARHYLAVVHGTPTVGAIETPLARDRGDGLRGVPLADGPPDSADQPPAHHTAQKVQSARTDVVAVPLSGGGQPPASLVVVALGTGRTHQVRIHLAEATHPIVGEPVYCRDAKRAGRALHVAPRLLLHAWRLAFHHPNTHTALTLEAPMPADFVTAAALALQVAEGDLRASVVVAGRAL